MRQIRRTTDEKKNSSLDDMKRNNSLNKETRDYEGDYGSNGLIRWESNKSKEGPGCSKLFWICIRMISTVACLFYLVQCLMIIRLMTLRRLLLGIVSDLLLLCHCWPLQQNLLGKLIYVQLKMWKILREKPFIELCLFGISFYQNYWLFNWV